MDYYNYGLEIFGSSFLFILLFIYTLFLFRKVCSKKYIDNISNLNTSDINNIEII